ATVAGALNNYNVTNNGADFTINKKAATWTTNANSKTYGYVDPSPLTTGSASGSGAADGASASYSRSPGETVAGSPYHITATMSATVAGPLHNADPSPLNTGSGSGFVAADGVSASYSRAPGKTVACSPYHITATLSATVAATRRSYDLTNNGADFTINKKAATWTTNANSKTYG